MPIKTIARSRARSRARSVVSSLVCGAVASVAAAALGSASAAAATPAAKSGSIVYIRNHNVWIVRGNLTGAHAVTKDGTAANPYRSPSESDTGRIAVAHGRYIVRMTQTGKVLNRIDPPALRSSAGDPMDGTVNEVSISPDGRTIAWGYVRYTCPVGVDCMVRYATGFTSALGRTYKRAGAPNYFHAASWVTNSRVLVGGGFLSQVMLQDLTARPRHWFDDSDYASPDTDLGDGEVASNGKVVAEVRGYGSTTHIIWYKITGDVRHGRPAVPTWTCHTSEEAGQASPTWSPDGTKLTFQGKGGVWLESNAAGCVNPKLVLKGATHPDWSAAPLT